MQEKKCGRDHCHLGWWDQQKGVDKDKFIVFLTRVILKSQSASVQLCKKQPKVGFRSLQIL